VSEAIVFDPELVRPHFQQVRLREVQANSAFKGGRRELSFKLERGIEVELRQPGDDGIVRAAVVVKLDTVAFEADESTPLLTVNAVYEGEFAFAEGVSFDQVQEPMAQRGYQRELVLQAYPVAFAMFRDFISSMGLLAGVMALTVP